MNTVSHSRRTLVRAAAVAVGAGTLLAFPAAAALADGIPPASSVQGVSVQRTLVKTLSLADGVSTAKVYRVAKGAYQAEVLNPDGSTAATLTSRDGGTGFGDAGTMHLALRSDGRLSSWAGSVAEDGAGAEGLGDAGNAGRGTAGHKTASRDGRVVPAVAPSRSGAAGTVEALGLHTLADGPGDGMLLLAAGGGIAAIGAAGLGFAMVRRGRTDA
ncbi:hypothetical protein OHA37_12120 [Streptomyces sp. NBC_00335]|uniref:hypothetical protein n=1 Tax=unclassified Streptomyces TaxID=2593676 RepID=UPI0022562B70|nr:MULTISPECIES: hypothetical protein [unclassified Streptomyces]MCX5404626.1 hypothetical protein [Streptomyces sp. NBC_00086]